MIFNIIIREINIRLIKKIGFHTESAQTEAIFLAIFIATFFNTAILLLLSNANTKGTVLTWLPLRGIYSDLDQNWYLSVGPSLIFTMWINAFYVYIDWVTYLGFDWFYRWLDNGSCCWCCRKKTKCVTQQQYVTLYSGPEFLIHFKYATIMNTIFVTMMYGLALPILFLIAAVTFINLLIMDKLCLTYYFQKPPMYDDRLNNSVLRLARWGPLFLLYFGYWCIGNKQIFDNTVNEIIYSNQPMDTSHTGLPYLGPDLPLFCMALATTIYLITSTPFKNLFLKCGCLKPEEEWDINEGLGTFFDCIDAWEQKLWYTKTVYNIKKLGLRKMDRWQVEELRNYNSCKKVMHAPINYELLSNYKYAKMLQYVPVEIRDTQEEIVASD